MPSHFETEVKSDKSMKGVSLDKVNGDYTIVTNLSKPVPGTGQILVKSLVTAINPVEPFMQNTGMLVTEWPIVLGCDASGIVVGKGDDVSKFDIGDGIYGCTRLGVPGYSTFQEYFLMDAKLAFKRPSNITTEQAATLGVGLLTASLGLIIGTKLPLQKVSQTKEWIIVLGAAGSVGQYAVQLAKLCGYKVLGSSSPSNDELVKKIGADATFDYHLSIAQQTQEIQSITCGNFARIFDASAQGTDTALAAFTISTFTQKLFATTNDWSPITPQDNITIYMVKLGHIGRSGDEDTKQTNADIASLIPQLEAFIESGDLVPMKYELEKGTDFKQVLSALEKFGNKSSNGSKLVVQIGEY